MNGPKEFNGNFLRLVSEEAGNSLNRFTFRKEWEENAGIDEAVVILAKPGFFTVGRCYIIDLAIGEAP